MLSAIVAHKREEVARRMRDRPLASFRGSLGPSDRSFSKALEQPETGFILECKRASPSRGVIRNEFDPAAIAASYAPFASAVSVLTDERYFNGSFEVLRAVRGAVTAPVLCKDFVVEPYQVYEARSHGADAILLMASVLSQAELVRCLAACREIGIDALVEVHDEEELARALALDIAIIGINNRDLRTLATDLRTTERLAPLVPEGRLVVSESGIASHADVVRLRPLVDAFLVGTSLMKEPSLDFAVRRLVFGRAKICGLTTSGDAAMARAEGALLGGLVFYPPSPRAVTLERATQLVRDARDHAPSAAPLSWVGVFVDEAPERVASSAALLGLAAVQLHGRESRREIEALRPLLPPTCEVWKALRVGDPELGLLPTASDLGVDRLLLDCYRPHAPGGTGESFDWDVVRARHDRGDLVLGGGLRPENAGSADALGVFALDVSSGVESAPGTKSHLAVREFFSALRGRRRH